MSPFNSALFIIAAAPCISAASQTFECPSRAQITSVVSSASGAAFPFEGTTIISSALLTGISVYEGRPERGGALKPSALSGTSEKQVIIWKFEVQKADSIWLTCDYANGVGRFAMEVSSAARSCTTQATRTKSPSLVKISGSCQ